MKNRYDSEQTVRDIIDVATTLFTEKGFEKTSIQDIVNGLEGLTRGAIYHHFASKEEIMIAVIRKRLPLTDFYYEDKLVSEIDGKSKLRALLVESLKSLKKEQQNEILKNNPRIFMEILRINTEVVAPQIKKILDLAFEDGSLAVESTKEVSEVLMLLVGSWFNTILYPDTDEQFEAKLHVLKRILDGINLDLLDETAIQAIVGE